MGAKKVAAKTAREVANRVLLRVSADEAWAGPTLDVELRRANLEPRDRALATEIVYGSLRTLGALDEVIGRFVKHPRKTHDIAQSAMRVASYQILYLERVPAHAAVDAAVSWVRGQLDRHVGGFVNAVLRKVAALRPAQPTRPSRLAVPPWLDGELRRSLGHERAEVFLNARRLPPPIGVRITGGPSAQELCELIREARPQAEVNVSHLSPRSLLVRGGGDPRRWPGFDEAHFVVQELGSQMVGECVNAQPGERVLDMCAGRGGKTLQLIPKVRPDGEVVATDLYEAKLDQLQAAVARLGWNDSQVRYEAIDYTVGAAGLNADFDRVLVDAPCTGVGTLHRRPELLLRLKPSDPERMGKLQEKILRRAIDLVKPGGELIYAVCSPLIQEGAAVFNRVIGESNKINEIHVAHPENSGNSDDGLPLMIGPWLGELDAYQVFAGKAV